MGLISRTVKIRLSSGNIKWFEEKGYHIPRTEKFYPNNDGGYRKTYATTQGTEITVNIEDLKPNSSVKVVVRCDYCDKKYEIEWRKYARCNHDGKIYCHSCVNKVLNSKENNKNWNFNKTQEEREKGRAYLEYSEFVQKVLARDNYTCVITGKTSKETDLEVHHLNGYNWCIEGRLDVKNAVTISKELHKLFHDKYGYGNNTKEQFLEFIGNYKLELEDYQGDFHSVKWIYCVTDNETIKNIIQYSKNNNIDHSSIYKCCNKKQYTCKNKVYIWYNEYLNMNDEELKDYIYQCKKANNHKQVICVNTNMLFDSSVCAGKYFGIDNSSIIRCINGKYNSAGKSSNGEKLIWKYAYEIDDIEKYVHISRDECEQIALSRSKESLKNDSFII